MDSHTKYTLDEANQILALVSVCSYAHQRFTETSCSAEALERLCDLHPSLATIFNKQVEDVAADQQSVLRLVVAAARLLVTQMDKPPVTTEVVLTKEF